MHIQLIDLPKVLDQRGNLSFIETKRHVPFDIKRVYWIYDIPGGQGRGAHAFRENEELIIALSGSFEVVLHDGRKEYRFLLNRSCFGLFVPSGIWRSMENFSTNSLAIVLASTFYSKDDYIFDFEEFVQNYG